MPNELLFVVWSVAIGFITVLLPTWFQLQVSGLKWNASPRDTPALPMSAMGERLDRARKNFLETYPLFLAAVLVAVASHHTNGKTLLGAELYVWGRLIYIPLYAFGIPYLRSLAWAASVAGIILILVGAVHT